MKIDLGVLQSEERLLRGGAAKGAARREVAPVALEMHVAVDEARQHRRVSEIDDLHPGGSAACNRIDAIAADDDPRIGNIARTDIEEPVRVQDHIGVGRRGENRDSQE